MQTENRCAILPRCKKPCFWHSFQKLSSKTRTSERPLLNAQNLTEPSQTLADSSVQGDGGAGVADPPRPTLRLTPTFVSSAAMTLYPEPVGCPELVETRNCRLPASPGRLKTMAR